MATDKASPSCHIKQQHHWAVCLLECVSCFSNSFFSAYSWKCRELQSFRKRKHGEDFFYHILYLLVTCWCCELNFPYQTFSKNINNRISKPAWATLSTWKRLAWNEIWVLRMLSRRSNSNTLIPFVQQQRDALLIICIPCIDSEREEGSHKWVESSASIFSGSKTMFWGWEVEDRKGRSKRRGMTSSNAYEANSVQTSGKTQQHGHHSASKLDPDIQTLTEMKL